LCSLGSFKEEEEEEEEEEDLKTSSTREQVCALQI